MNKEYLDYIEQEIRPWLYEHVNDGYCESRDKRKLHYYEAINPDEKASIVIVHGFCEFFGKYHETAMRFYQAGYSVFFIELRGHGRSEDAYELEDRRVHIENFNDYVEDVHSFIEQIVLPHTLTGKLFLFAHSMGGAVGALFLEKYPEVFRCAVLSSPMLQLDIKNLPEWVLSAMRAYPKVTRKKEDFAPGQGPFTFINEFEHSSCLDPDRYEYQFLQRCQDPAYQTWGGTWGWCSASVTATEKLQKNVDQIRIPVLICQAGKDTMVRNDGQDTFCRHSEFVTLVTYPDSKHEIFNADDDTRTKYYKDVLDFFRVFC